MIKIAAYGGNIHPCRGTVNRLERCARGDPTWGYGMECILHYEDYAECLRPHKYAAMRRRSDVIVREYLRRKRAGVLPSQQRWGPPKSKKEGGAHYEKSEGRYENFNKF